MFRKSRKLQFESMESRQLMTGDVMAFVANGSLHVVEAPNQVGYDSNIEIAQVAEGVVRVTARGTDADGNPRHVTTPYSDFGAEYVDFVVPGNLNVTLGGGNDVVQFSTVSPPKFNDISIDVGVEPTMQQIRYARWADITLSDQDLVMLSNFESNGSVVITTGSDSDGVYLTDANVGADFDSASNLTINTGTGSDTVRLKTLFGAMQVMANVDIQTYRMAGEGGADRVYLERNWIGGELSVRTGAGEDGLFMDHSFIKHTFNFDLGAGNDEANLLEVVALDMLWAQTGSGDETLPHQLPEYRSDQPGWRGGL